MNNSLEGHGWKMQDANELARLRAKVIELKEKLDAVKTDKEIIDWMSRREGYTAMWQRLGDGVWCVDLGDEWDDGPHHGDTAREALLKAMGQAKDGE